MSTTTAIDGAALLKDRTRLSALVRALSASDLALRRERCRGELGDYAIVGKSGHVYPDGNGFLLYVETTPRRWSSVKRKLAFCRITQDGDDEGCLYLDRLPTGDEADLIRSALGIKRKRHLSPEARVSLAGRLPVRTGTAFNAPAFVESVGG